MDGDADKQRKRTSDGFGREKGRIPPWKRKRKGTETLIEFIE